MRSVVFLAMIAWASLMAAPSEYLMYLGGYTFKDGKGIYVYRFDSSSGKLKPLGLAAETPIRLSWRFTPTAIIYTPSMNSLPISFRRTPRRTARSAHS